MCAARVSTAVALSTSVQNLLHFDRCQRPPATDRVSSAGKTEKTLYCLVQRKRPPSLDPVSRQTEYRNHVLAKFRGWAVSVFSGPCWRSCCKILVQQMDKSTGRYLGSAGTRLRSWLLIMRSLLHNWNCTAIKFADAIRIPTAQKHCGRPEVLHDIPRPS